VTVRAYLRLVLLAALVGVPAAFLAALFLALVHQSEHWLWDDLPAALGGSSPQWYLVIGLPVAGAGIVLAARLLLPGDGGHSPLLGLSSTPVPVRYVPGVVLAAIGTLGFGGVLGPEMPVIALGSATAMAFTKLARLGDTQTALLSNAGSFSAMSALFGGPLVAGILLVEGGLSKGRALLTALLPGLVAAAVGYVIFVGFGSWGGLNAAGLTVPGLTEYRGTHLLDLLVGLGTGITAGVVITISRRLGTTIDGMSSRLGMPWLLLGGALAVGMLAESARLLGADSQDVLFSGQTSVPSVVAAGSTRIIVIVLVAKALSYAVCLGCGYRGGPIFPAIFLGVALASLPVVWFGVSPTLAIAVGAAAGMAAQTQLLISPLLFASLLVGANGTDAMPAAVFAAAAAWLTVQAMDRDRSDKDDPQHELWLWLALWGDRG
jgi:H+/Cl- antiporter ClcA